MRELRTLCRLREYVSSSDNHLGAQGATPDSGGELLTELPSSVEEWWRAEHRGGAEQHIKRVRVGDAYTALRDGRVFVLRSARPVRSL